MTLHEAIIYVIKRYGPLSAKEVAIIINKEHLYSRSDKASIPTTQILARVSQYPDLFKLDALGIIHTEIDEVKELISFAWKIQEQVNHFFHRSDYFYPSDYFVPLLFFIKRMIDNPQICRAYFNFEVQKSSFDKDFRFFINNAPINLFNAEFKILDWINNRHKEIFLTSNVPFVAELDNLDLRQESISIKIFGAFFNDLICTITRQNGWDFSTPKTIGRLFYEICKEDIQDRTKLYNPAAGYSTLPILFSQLSNKKFNFFGEELNQRTYTISLMNLIANNLDIKNFSNTNSLYSLRETKSYYDLIICVPPFGKYPLNELSKDNKVAPPKKDFSIIFIDLIVEKLAPGGKAVVLVPESILFNKKTEYKDFRRNLIESKILEGIISLPTGVIKPFWGIKTDILILSKRNNISTIFLDAENAAFNHYDSNKNIVLDHEAISMEYFSHIKDSNILQEPTIHYEPAKFNEDTKTSYWKSRSLEVSFKTIINSIDDLSVKRYLLQENSNETKIEIKEILSYYSGGKNISLKELNFINISDLNNNFYDFYLNENSLNRNQNSKNGRIIDIPALLISSIPPNVKATYFKNEGMPVVVSRNIHAFRINSSQIDIQYLIFELNSDYAKDYLSAISSGTTSLRRFSADDFLKLKIVLPDLEKQKEIVKLKMEAILAEKARDLNSFMENSGLTVKSEKEILGFVKHEIGNLTGGISNNFSLIEHFLRTKNLDFSEKISVRQGAPTLEKVFKSLTSSIKDINDMMKNIQNIIDFGNRELKLGLLNFPRYIQQEVEKYSHLLNENNAEVLIGIENIYQLQSNQEIEIDPVQFSVVLRNFIDNSIKHGYSSPSQQKTLVINLNTDADFYYLHLANDGDPFPEGFKLEDFVSFGGRMNMSKGSGLGGFLINKVILNHKGSIELMESGKAMFLSYPGERNKLEKFRQIKTGVHFLIKIPKIN